MSAVVHACGFKVVRQTPHSLGVFGDVKHVRWRDLKHPSHDEKARCMQALEQVADEGGIVRLRLWVPEPAEFVVRDIDDGELLTTWRPLTHEERVAALTSWYPERPHPGLR